MICYLLKLLGIKSVCWIYCNDCDMRKSTSQPGIAAIGKAISGGGWGWGGNILIRQYVDVNLGYF